MHIHSLKISQNNLNPNTQMFVSITNRVLLSLLLVWCSLSSLRVVNAACENLCSGHGICLSDDVCQCYDGWGLGVNELSGDCSERYCPFDVAWVDTPDSFGNFHKYLECSGRGICDRTLGECVCFDGYSGSGCYRTSCPNDCSGHGNCEFIEDVPFAGTYNEYSVGYAGDAWLGGRGLKEMEKQIRFEYPQWDKQKSMECVCDPHYGDLDCSKRMCPFGTDVLDVSDSLLVEQGVHTQTIQFVIANSVFDGGDGVASDSTYDAGKSFSLLFKSQLNETFQTIPIVFDNAIGGHAADMARDIQVALLTLPNRVIDGVKVTCEWDFTNALYFDKLLCVVKFTGSSVQGKQHLLSVDAHKCGAGCSPRITGLWLDSLNRVTNADMNKVYESAKSDLNSFECGRRGKCDYETGLCQCFTGYTGVSCNALNALV